MHFTIERRMRLGFGFIAFLLLSVTAISFQRAARQRQLNYQVADAYQVQTQILDVLELVTKARAGERGFLLTGDPHFIDPRAHALADIEAEIDTLQRLTTDNPVQQANAVRLRKQITAGMKVVEKVIALGKQGRIAAARQIIASPQTKTIWQQIEQNGETIKREESRLLQQRTATAKTYQRNTDRLFLFIRFLMLTSLIVVYLGARATHSKTIAVLENISDAFFSLDANWNFTYVNNQSEVQMHKKREELLGKNFWKIFPDAEDSEFGRQYRRAVKENIKVEFASFYAPRHCWIEVVACPSSKGLSVYFRDITERKAADERFRVLFERSSDAHLLFDDTGIVDCNNAAIQMLGYEDKSAVLALHPAVLSPEFQLDGKRSEEKGFEMERLARANGYHRFEWMHRKADGTDIMVEVTLTLVHLNGKETLLTVWHDLTERIEAERENARLATILESSPDFVGTASQEGYILYQNRAFNEALKVSREEIATRPHFSRFMPPYALQKMQQEILPALVQQGHWQGECAMLSTEGTEIPVLMTAIGHKDAVSDVPYISVICHDITERKEAEARLESVNEQFEYQMLLVNEQSVELEAQKMELEEANQRLTALAITDGLTGLYNHRAFQEKLTAEFARTQRYKTPLSIILLDVDKFKTYNDTFGHPQGDKVLKTVAQVLQEVARDTDYVCRYGGEEFVIVLPNTEVMGALAVAERFRDAVEQQPWALRPVTASFGIATLYTTQTTVQELIDQADKALYASKENGRNRCTHYVDIVALKELDELEGNTSQPYSDIVREMLLIQQDTLASASEQMREMLASAYNATIQSWSHLLDMKDKETEGHSERVTEMMVRLARSIGMNEEETMYARWGALLHDVGKMGVPDSILHKPGPLTAEEWVVMRQHTTVAYKMLSPITFLRPALDIPYCHHEKWDGTGYPRALKGEDIPLSARLFAVIDVYDALTSDRPYREAWSQEKTIAHLQSLSGTHFDPRTVSVFLAMLGQTALPQGEAPERLAA